MSDTFGSAEELYLNACNRIREFLIQMPELVIYESGFHTELDNSDRLVIPHKALDWKSLVLSGHHGDYTRELGPINNWQSIIHFREPQTGTIQVQPYNRLSCLVLADVEDVPRSFSAYFSGDDDSITPLAVPVVDGQHSSIVIRNEKIEMNFHGSLAVYGPPTGEGMEKAARELIRLGFALGKNGSRMAAKGLNDMRTGPHETHMFSEFSEASLELRGTVLINSQEDHYWTTVY